MKLHSMELHSFILKITQEYIIKKKLVKSVKVLPASIKSMNPIQKYPHIIGLFACILNMFVFMFLCPINFSVYLGTCSTAKLSK